MFSDIDRKARISSILKSSQIDPYTSGFPSFYLSKLQLREPIEINYIANLRLGQQVERIVSALIKSSSNYELLYQNIQLIDQKITIGELDFILKEVQTDCCIHVELAYKFYLFNPKIEGRFIDKWVGPNQKDSLSAKLIKLQKRQFPLLYHPTAAASLPKIDSSTLQQQLCFLVSLYIPYQNNIKLPANFQKSVKGYYINISQLRTLDHRSFGYYIPPKREWGIDPSTNEQWETWMNINSQVEEIISSRNSLMCWKKNKNEYTAFFVVNW